VFNRGDWVAQSVKRPPPAQVTIPGAPGKSTLSNDTTISKEQWGRNIYFFPSKRQ